MNPKTVWLSALYALVFFMLYAGIARFAFRRPPQVVQAATSYNPKSGDPCAINLRVSAPISLAASGQLIAGASGKQTYVCGMTIVNAAAQNIALVEGTGTSCGTGTVGMAGGNTPGTGWNLGVNQALSIGSPGSWSMVTLTTGDNICFLLSGTTQVSGFISYAQM